MVDRERSSAIIGPTPSKYSADTVEQTVMATWTLRVEKLMNNPAIEDRVFTVR